VADCERLTVGQASRAPRLARDDRRGQRLGRPSPFPDELAKANTDRRGALDVDVSSRPGSVLFGPTRLGSARLESGFALSQKREVQNWKSENWKGDIIALGLTCGQLGASSLPLASILFVRRRRRCRRYLAASLASRHISILSDLIVSFVTFTCCAAVVAAAAAVLCACVFIGSQSSAEQLEQATQAKQGPALLQNLAHHSSTDPPASVLACSHSARSSRLLSPANCRRTVIGSRACIIIIAIIFYLFGMVLWRPRSY
jgi:hypothetical protein